MNNSNELEGCLGKVVLVLLATAVGALLGGWILASFWEWFILPVFDLPPLTIAQAIGVSFTVSYMTKNSVKNNEETTKERMANLISNFLVLPFILYGFGWIIHLFIGA